MQITQIWLVEPMAHRKTLKKGHDAIQFAETDRGVLVAMKDKDRLVPWSNISHMDIEREEKPRRGRPPRAE